MATPLRDGDPTHIGPYTLHARLGGGGMGRVFLGRSPGGHTVAVKVVHPDLAEDPAFRRRFATEVKAARKVGGFYTAPVVDADPDAAPPWLATAYIPGPTLYEAVQGHGTLPAASVAALGAGLAEGLAAIHACGIVHRDLKPGNVLLAADGPRVIDFGIARALDTTSATRTRTVVGTAGFMSPEQVRGADIGSPSDVFALGCVLGYAATGHSPFGEGPIEALGYRIVHENPDLSGVPADVARTVRACLAKDPHDRPGLEEVLADLTIPAASASGDPRRSWLPEDLTEIIADRTLTFTRAETGQKRRSKRDAAKPKKKRRPPPATEREAPGPETAELVIGNFSTGPLDVIVDGTALGQVQAGATVALRLTPGRRSLLVEVPGRRGVVRSVRMKTKATLKMAFDTPRGRESGPELVQEVVFTKDRLQETTRVAFWTTLIAGGPLSGVAAASGAEADLVIGLAGFGLVCGAVVGIEQFFSPARLIMDQDGLTIPPALSGTKKRLLWDSIGQVSVVGEQGAALLVFWPPEGESRLERANGPEGTIRYPAKAISAVDEQSLDRLRAVLRWFAGDAYVHQAR